jgi:hypothetical protein
MTRGVALLACLWGFAFSLMALINSLALIASADRVDWSTWSVVLTNESRTAGHFAVEQEHMPTLWLPYFALSAAFFVAVALLASNWLSSPRRTIWFGICAAITMLLAFVGLVGGAVLFGIPLLAFLWLAFGARTRTPSPTNSAQTPGS